MFADGLTEDQPDQIGGRLDTELADEQLRNRLYSQSASAKLLAAPRSALDGAGRPGGRLDVASFRPVTFAVGMAVLVAADRRRDAVLRSVTGALRAAFSFDRRAFAQLVTAAEVITVAHQVPGVVAVNLTALHLSGAGPFGTARFDAARFDAALVADVLPARRAHLAMPRDADPGIAPPAVVPAELLLADPAQITVTEMVP